MVCKLFIEFASWAYPDYQLNITSVVLDVDDNFNNLAWNVDSVSSGRFVTTLWDVYDYSFAQYVVKISRYSGHYVRTSILPALLTTMIVLCGLWVNTIPARLSLSVTGFLTNIAVQVRTCTEAVHIM